MKMRFFLLSLASLLLASTIMAQPCCPPAVICNSKSINSCYAVDTSFPICNASRKHYCWNIIKLQYGGLSRENRYDRPPLNNMCYYLNDCGFYSIILDYQGEKAYKWAI